MSNMLFETTQSSAALISMCGRYRYWLRRTWGDAPPLCFVMLNPSTADATEDDPTIRRCAGFAKRENAGGIVVVNLFAHRATDPTELLGATGVVGPENDGHILASTEGRRIVAAWGCMGSQYGRDRQVMRLLQGRIVECLGVTKDGRPRHPLYVKADAPLVAYGTATESP